MFFGDKITSDIDYEEDLKREVIFFDFSDDSITNYERQLFKDMSATVDTHNFLTYLNTENIVWYEVIDLSQKSINPNAGWYGISNTRVLELQNNPPTVQTPAYLMKIINFSKLHDFCKEVGFLNKPSQKNPYTHLNKRAIRYHEGNFECYGHKMKFNKNDAGYIFAALLRLSSSGNDKIKYDVLISETEKERALTGKKGPRATVIASLDTTISKKISSCLKIEEKEKKAAIAEKLKPKITTEKSSVVFFNPKLFH